jgi:hypothetical protein
MAPTGEDWSDPNEIGSRPGSKREAGTSPPLVSMAFALEALAHSTRSPVEVVARVVRGDAVRSSPIVHCTLSIEATGDLVLAT